MKSQEAFEKFFKSGSPLLIAHRGLSAIAPENTLSAFKIALRHKADMIELDVRITKDGTPVVIHDAKVNRTTNGTGKVKDLYLWLLRELDAGSWFHPKYKGEKIPTLEEVLELFAKKVPINIEIKSSSLKDRITEKVLAIVFEKQCEDKVLISSFDPRILKKIKKLTNEIPTAFLYHYPVYFNPIKTLKNLGTVALIHNYKFTTPNLVKKIHSAGFKIFVYTVNKPEDIKRMINFGVDGIITDDVRLAKRILNNI
ncbi:MAG: glycerophosphodiester phosphodiesterase family protein [Candidatus Kryptonium sp.]|nr:glycerophosphodiester phosphodiesterase [Candidatus Kryptonium sp.]MCX7762163.1 glycerophosphodiester phosphodiesterase family protein [Candidatus Kryptonium sp.]MDW8108987.1 glycerophosphodiester phosphodiesterase family protein [Candidatus Kryptonium sp.]